MGLNKLDFLRRACLFPISLLATSAYIAGAEAPGGDAESSPPPSGSSPWDTAIPLSDGNENAVSPAVAVCSDGNVHVVWVQGRDIYHKVLSGGTWSTEVRVAAGESPDLACSGDTLHMVFSYRFGTNYEIYTCSWDGSWTLPHNISHTAGASGGPKITVAGDGTLHVVWFDNTPGYNIIYHAYKSNGYWNNAPLPQGQGTAPDIAADTSGKIHVVWQNKGVGTSYYEIYHSQWGGHGWSLPENISDTPGAHSLASRIANGGDTIHILWEERLSQGSQIYHSSGHQRYWSVPKPVYQNSRQAHQPVLAVDDMGYAYVIWQEGQRLLGSQIGPGGGEWWAPHIVAQSSRGLDHPDIAVRPDGSVHAVWTERTDDGFWEVMYSHRPSAWKKHFMPLA